MGNENSRPVEQSYTDYITQQQRLIQAQQEQINQLSRMNLRQNILNQQQLPSNIMFKQTAEQQQQYQQQQSIGYQTNPQITYQPDKKKLNPYKILGVPKNYDEKVLKKAYLKMAMKTRPDRGGSARTIPTRISIAYCFIKKIKRCK